MRPARWLAGVAALAAAEGWRRREAETIGLTHRGIALPCWPDTLNGFRVLLVSDLHIRPEARKPGRRERRLAAMLPGLDCDVLLTPGDCGNTRGAARVAAEVLRCARPRYGAFFTLGNGEHKRPEETEPIVRELAAVGRVLMNDAACLAVNGVELWILGVDDPGLDRDRLDRAARSSPENAPRILLAHSPEIVTRLHRAPVDLVVCGHTHGGQVCPPGGEALWTQTPALNRSSLGYGLYGPADFAPFNPRPLERTRMYVSRGVGTAKLPIRAFCRPEIALLTLTRAEPERTIRHDG